MTTPLSGTICRPKAETCDELMINMDTNFEVSSLSPVSYTHLTLPTIYSV